MFQRTNLKGHQISDPVFAFPCLLEISVGGIRGWPYLRWPLESVGGQELEFKAFQMALQFGKNQMSTTK